MKEDRMKKVLVVIPARGGSKRLPGKNIKPLNGEPLINYTVSAAREVFDDRQIYVSTDNDAIKKTVEKTGLRVPFDRPRELANDDTDTQAVLLHAVDFAERNGFFPEIIMLLQPTSPFRRAQHIKEALEIYDQKLDMVVSVFETKSNPYFVMREEDEKGYLQDSKKADFTRSQDCPSVWQLNGAIYIINLRSLRHQKIRNFEKVKKYEMEEKYSLDIDDAFDWHIAESLFSYLDNESSEQEISICDISTGKKIA